MTDLLTMTLGELREAREALHLQVLDLRVQIKEINKAIQTIEVDPNRDHTRELRYAMRRTGAELTIKRIEEINAAIL